MWDDINMLHIYIIYLILYYSHCHNSSFLHYHVLNLLAFVMALFDLLLYFDIYIYKNMNYQFVDFANSRNFFLYLII